MSDDKVAAFGGTLAEFYDRYLVPMMFAPYAEIVANRAKGLLPRRVLETAAGREDQAQAAASANVTMLLTGVLRRRTSPTRRHEVAPADGKRALQ